MMMFRNLCWALHPGIDDERKPGLQADTALTGISRENKTQTTEPIRNHGLALADAFSEQIAAGPRSGPAQETDLHRPSGKEAT